jgi:hypothetical protein
MCRNIICSSKPSKTSNPPSGFNTSTQSMYSMQFQDGK